MSRAPLCLLSLLLVGVAAAQDPSDDAPRPGEGIGLRLGAWSPTRSGSNLGFSYGVGYLIPDPRRTRPFRVEAEFFGATSKMGGGASANIYKLGANLLYEPANRSYYYGAGLGVGGGSGSGGRTHIDLVGTVLAGYRVDRNVFFEARFQGGTREFLNGFAVNLGYRY